MAGGVRKAGDLSPFCARLTADWLVTAPDERHRRLDGTLVSADLSGFTAMSERLAAKGKAGAEELTASINECFTALIAAADAEGGDVLKFGGDALLVWFDGADHAVRAVRACARMQVVIGGARFRRSGLAMSVGAHSGSFDMYLVGRPDWRELVLAGAPVSTTVSLEAAAWAGEILVSPATAGAVPPEWRGSARDGGVLVAIDAVPAGRARRRAERDVVAGNIAARLVPPRLQADLVALAATSGEHRLATIVFVEVEGTDEKVAALGAAFADPIDGLIRAVQDGADRYRILFLYTDVIADGIKVIVVAGAPVSTGEDEEAGVRFATELVHGDPEGQLRAGVNRGRIFAGFLGSPDRRTYTVMGDPANLATRLMAQAEHGQVVGSDGVVHRTRSAYELQALEPFLVKGKSEPITAHVVGMASGATNTRESHSVPLVGREAEVATLRAAIESAAAGRGRVVEVIGDAGIGKTRLLEAVADDPRIEARVHTECQPYDGLSPYAAIRPLLRRAAAIDVGAPPADAGHRLVDVTGRVAPELTPLLPLIAVPFGAAVDPTPEADAVADEFRQARMIDAVLELLAGLLPHATLLVVEDVYYVDDASLQLLRALAARVRDHPWALFVTRRPEGAALVADVRDGTVLKLPPLEPALVDELAGIAIGDALVRTTDLRLLSERSGGNPLFVLELVEAARSGLVGDELPESIERLVAARVDRLDPDDRAVLRQAAVAGRVFHEGLVDAVVVADGRPPVSDAQWSRLAEFVEPEGERRRRFRHALFRDVAYEGLPFARRKRMHGDVGELLEAGVAGPPEIGLLSLHFWLAGDAERTWKYSVDAGAAAWKDFAVAEAVAAYRRALEMRRRVRDVTPDALAGVHEVLGDALERLGRYDEAAAEYARARRALPAGGPTARAARLVRKLGVVCERTGRYSMARRWYTGGLRSLGDESDPGALEERAELELARAGVEHRQGRLRALRSWAERAEGTADAVGSVRLVADALNLQLVAATYLDIGAVAPLGERALRLYRSIDDILREGSALNNIGVAEYFRGAWSDAARSYAAAADALERAGNVVDAATARNNLAEIWSDQGSVEAAIEAFEVALRAWRATGYSVGVAVAEGNLGRARARTGAFDEAQRLLRSSLERYEALGATSLAWEGRARIAECHVLAGETAVAVAVLDDRAGLDAEAYPATRASWARLTGWTHVQRGAFEAALEAFGDSRAQAEEARADYEIALAVHALAELAAMTADPRLLSFRAEADALLERLGIVRVPAVPRRGAAPKDGPRPTSA